MASGGESLGGFAVRSQHTDSEIGEVERALGPARLCGAQDCPARLILASSADRRDRGVKVKVVPHQTGGLAWAQPDQQHEHPHGFQAVATEPPISGLSLRQGKRAPLHALDRREW